MMALEIGGTLLTWSDDQVKFDTSIAKRLFDDVGAEAGFRADDGGESLFGDERSEDLQIGAKVTGMKGVFCSPCTLFIGKRNAWGGKVTMDVTWEVYSSRDRQVLARVETYGGFTAPAAGLIGEPELLIYEAFKDNARRLTADSNFRRIVGGQGTTTSLPKLEPVRFRTVVSKPRTVASAVNAAVAVFANEGHGTGFLISSDGYVLTNQHVVGGSKFVKVRWSDGAESVGEVLRVDRRRDVALIKVDAGGRAPLAYRTGAEVGQAVFAIGTPLDGRLQSTVTKGIVSAKRTFDGQDFIQSDVAVSPGNSGGPLLTEDGVVIGITEAAFQPNGSQVGLNLFIPIQQALDALALIPVN